MEQLSFFTQMQKGAGSTGRPVDAGDAQSRVRTSSDYDVVPPPQEDSESKANGVRRARGSEIPLSSDIRRIVEHKAGPLRELLEDGVVGREFRLAELTDGRFVRIFDDGSREPSPVAVTPFLIDDAIRFGTFVEVVCAAG